MAKVLGTGLFLLDVCLQGVTYSGTMDYDLAPLSLVVTAIGLLPLVNHLADRLMARGIESPVERLS